VSSKQNKVNLNATIDIRLNNHGRMELQNFIILINRIWLLYPWTVCAPPSPYTAILQRPTICKDCADFFEIEATQTAYAYSFIFCVFKMR